MYTSRTIHETASEWDWTARQAKIENLKSFTFINFTGKQERKKWLVFSEIKSLLNEIIHGGY